MSDQSLEDLLEGVQSDVDAEGLDGDEEFIFDFSDAGKGVDFKVGAPHGQRPCRIRSVKPGKSKAGNPTIIFQFQVLEPSAWKGKVFFLHAPASGAMSSRGQEVLRAVGIAVDEDDPVLRFRRDDVVDQHVVVESKPQKGKPQYDDILAVLPADAEVWETIDGEVVSLSE